MEYVTNLDKTDPSVATTSRHGLSFTHPVKYYDFHVYYYAHNSASTSESDKLRQKLLDDFPDECGDGSIIVKKLPDSKVIGPHPTQFWEADICRPEVFIEVLSWFQLHHGNLSILIHPQTGDDVEDHTNRALWLGEKLPLLLNVFKAELAGTIPEFGVKGGKMIEPEMFDEYKTIIENS